MFRAIIFILTISLRGQIPKPALSLALWSRRREAPARWMLEVCLGGGVQVQNGKGAMPAWKDTLDDDEIEAVANYVFETAKADGW